MSRGLSVILDEHDRADTESSSCGLDLTFPQR